MGAENVFRTLNIQRLLSYSKQILICETFFFLYIVISEIELKVHEVMF